MIKKWLVILFSPVLLLTGCVILPEESYSRGGFTSSAKRYELNSGRYQREYRAADDQRRSMIEAQRRQITLQQQHRELEKRRIAQMQGGLSRQADIHHQGHTDPKRIDSNKSPYKRPSFSQNKPNQARFPLSRPNINKNPDQKPEITIGSKPHIKGLEKRPVQTTAKVKDSKKDAEKIKPEKKPTPTQANFPPQQLKQDRMQH